MTRALLAIFVLLSALVAPRTSSAAPADGTRTYTITRNGSDLGTHVISFKRVGPRLVVEHQVRVLVKVVFVTAYRFEADRTETWEDDRLVAFRSRTNDNGTKLDVSVARNDDGLEIHSSAIGVQKAATDAGIPGPGWNSLGARPNHVIEPDRGRVLNVTVSAAAEETLTIGGRQVKCQRVRITGDYDATLWFDASGLMVKERLKARDGSMVETVLQ
jgi:Domain of unknown function (DUF6134)